MSVSGRNEITSRKQKFYPTTASLTPEVIYCLTEEKQFILSFFSGHNFFLLFSLFLSLFWDRFIQILCFPSYSFLRYTLLGIISQSILTSLCVLKCLLFLCLRSSLILVNNIHRAYRSSRLTLPEYTKSKRDIHNAYLRQEGQSMNTLKASRTFTGHIELMTDSPWIY